MSLAVSLQYVFPKRAITDFGRWVANGRWGAVTQWIIRRFMPPESSPGLASALCESAANSSSFGMRSRTVAAGRPK